MPLTIALLGDSHMQALGPDLETLLAADGHRVVRVTANAGWSTARYLQSGLVRGGTQGAELAIVELGGNDRYVAEIGLQAYAVQLAQLRSQVASPKVLWVGPAFTPDPEVGPDHNRAAAAQSKIVPKLGDATWFDSRPYTQSGQRGMDTTMERVHFTPEGYQAWAKGIRDAVAWVDMHPLMRAVYMNFGWFELLRGLA